MPFTFEENVLLKFLGKKMDGVLPNFGKRNGLLVRLTIFYGKSTKLVQMSEKSAVHAHGLFERNTQQPGLKSGRLCCLGSSAAERVSHSNFQPGRS